MTMLFHFADKFDIDDTKLIMCKGVDRHSHQHLQQDSRRNKYPLAPSQAILLVISSGFFFIPSLYAISLQAYFQFLLSFISSLISMLYWYHAVPGWRKTLDLYSAKIAFVGYVATAFYYVKEPTLHYIGWPIGGLIVYCYTQSCDRWQKDEADWIIYHMLFHALVAVNQCIVLYGTFVLI